MVKINEFITPQKDNLPFDIVDDLHVFMKNDKMFYRKHYYPLMLQLENIYKNKEKVDYNKFFTPMIDTALKNYCKTYDLTDHPSEIFTEKDRKELIQRMYGEEINNIRHGEY